MKREGEVRIPAGCAIAAIFSKDGHLVDGSRIITMIQTMHERSNGLGGGFVGYDIYPEYQDDYAIHMFFDDLTAKRTFESELFDKFKVFKYEEIPTRQNPGVVSSPLIWRYFVLPLEQRTMKEEENFMVATMLDINERIEGAYCFSMGKNMGVFKGVGYPEDLGDFYMLDKYQATCWIAHGRYPTNTPGWWGGAHPFSLLDMALVHNGEISSYDTNCKMLEMVGYKCSLQTDTEAIAYMIDDLTRHHGFTLEECAHILAAPFWSEIEKMEDGQKNYYTYLRKNFADYLICGPFSIIVGFKDGIMALNDRCKLRSLVMAENESTLYLASEESAIRALKEDVDKISCIRASEAVIYKRGEKHA